MHDEVRPLSRSLLKGIRILHRLRVRGIGRLFMMIARHNPRLHAVPVPMEDGRTLFLDLRDPYQIPYFLDGRIPWEQGETQFVRKVVRSGDVVVDGGAYVGWYTTLLAELVGPHGKVYAFEPNAHVYRLLARAAGKYNQVRVMCAALGQGDEETVLYVPPADSWKASLTPLVPPSETQKCRVVALDEVVGADNPVFVKLDIEGAELEALQGARGILEIPFPPIWMVEVSPENLRRFGRRPEDLFRFFEAFPQAEYTPFRIRSYDGFCEPLALLPPEGMNSMFYAAFIPKWLSHRVEGLVIS